MLLKEVCKISANNYQKKDNWSYFNYLDTGSLTKNNIEGFQKFNSTKELPSRAKQKVEKDTILYSSVRPNQEHYGYIDKDYDNLLVSTGFIILEPTQSKVNPKYLYYYITQKRITDLLQGIAQNSTSSYPSITKDDLLDLEIDLPPRPIQDKIVEILSNIDSQIERNNTMVKTLQVLGNTIYSNNALNQKDTFNISNVATPIWGVCPSGEHILDANTNNTIKYASGAGDIDDNLISLNPKGYTDLPSKKVNKKDICISVAGTVGKIGIANEEIAIGRAMLGFSNKELYGYLYFGLSFYSETLKKKSTGAIQKIINTSHIEVINLPKYTNQVATQLNNIVDMILNIETQTLQLNQLKQTLLPLLINGQLVV